MCGFVGTTQKKSQLAIIQAIDQIAHRGPDETRIYQSDQLSVGFARLSIVEIQGGSQPFFDESGWIVAFNGEIYNYVNLRRQLEHEGFTFLGTSEAEVICKAFLAWGVKSFSMLRGMFAISIMNEQARQVWLIRDPIGKKPLYWRLIGDEIQFGSEIKSLWALEAEAEIELDNEALIKYLISDSIPTPHSADLSIRKLMPGHYLSWISGNATVSKFWSPPSRNSSNSQNSGGDFSQVLETAVERRLTAEVPVGIFLSGGLDSRLIASTVRKIRSRENFPCYGLKFDGAFNEFDESRHAAQSFGFQLHEVHATDEEMAQAWFEVKKTLDEPLNDPAILPMWILCKRAKDDVKVVLSGDGGDELFQGYPHLKLHKKVEKLQRFPRFDEFLSTFLSEISDNGDYFSLGFKAQRFARGVTERNYGKRDLAWRGTMSFESASRLLVASQIQDQDPERIYSDLQQHLQEASGLTVPARVVLWYMQTYLMDTVLTKVDRASMAHGVEVRSPLLDIDLVEYVFLQYQIGSLPTKQPKKTIEDELKKNGHLLPRKKRKHGMGVPVQRLLRTVLKEELHRLLDPELIREQQIFQPEAIQSLVMQFLDGHREIRKEVWSIFVFQGWYEQFIIRRGMNAQLGRINE
jgi:asparagine synthase (glutamine-hydrolysing)